MENFFFRVFTVSSRVMAGIGVWMRPDTEQEKLVSAGVLDCVRYRPLDRVDREHRILEYHLKQFVVSLMEVVQDILDAGTVPDPELLDLMENPPGLNLLPLTHYLRGQIMIIRARIFILFNQIDKAKGEWDLVENFV